MLRGGIPGPLGGEGSLAGFGLVLNGRGVRPQGNTLISPYRLNIPPSSHLGEGFSQLQVGRSRDSRPSGCVFFWCLFNSFMKFLHLSLGQTGV